MRLQKLTHLEHDKLEDEKNQLLKTIEFLEGLLSDHDKMSQVIVNELLDVKARYQDERRSRIVNFDNTLLEEEIELKEKAEQDENFAAEDVPSDNDKIDYAKDVESEN